MSCRCYGQKFRAERRWDELKLAEMERKAENRSCLVEIRACAEVKVWVMWSDLENVAACEALVCRTSMYSPRVLPHWAQHYSAVIFPAHYIVVSLQSPVLSFLLLSSWSLPYVWCCSLHFLISVTLLFYICVCVCWYMYEHLMANVIAIIFNCVVFRRVEILSKSTEVLVAKYS